MAYSIQFSPRAVKTLQHLLGETGKRIYERCMELADDPRPAGVCKLKDRALDGWRIRIGDYRVLYIIDDAAKVVQVYCIDLRAEAYKRK